METRVRRGLASVVGHPPLQLIDDYTVVSDVILPVRLPTTLRHSD